jgi:translation initiation factor 3 subunit I
LALFDPSTGNELNRWKAHDASITTLCFNPEKSLLLTSSKDRTAKLWEVSSWELLLTYEADAPLNSVAFSPLREHIVAGGGQEAMSVTTSSADAGKFESRFYHMIFGNELGRVKGHFGPINTISFNPDGRSYATGGEDGYIRIHPLDEVYDRLGEDDDRDLDDSTLAAAIEDGTLERLQQEENDAQKQAEAAEVAAMAAK